MRGKGLNSIRNRFTVMIVVFVLFVSVTIMAIDRVIHLHNLGIPQLALIACTSALIPGLLTYYMAGRLTELIHQLRISAEAIAAGDFNEAVDVNCACEIGGLADSFRTMVARLNSNILRMNVLAYSDHVTRLPNRAVINHVLSRSMRPGTMPAFAGAVMFIDLDKFKQVNDTLGHDAGDELLRLASLRILHSGFDRTPATIDNCMTAFGELCDRPPSDIVFARFAGDEFVAVLPGMTNRDELERCAARVIDSLNEPFQISSTDVSVGASIGIAMTPRDTGDPSELLNFADLAMYAAKQRGRGRYAFFDSKLRETAIQRVNIERELREAIPRGEFTVHFQPKVSAASLSVTGVESLARWNHPLRGTLTPRDFIDVAEQSGLIEPLGEMVLRAAMEHCAAWAQQDRPTHTAINVSQLQFGKPDFVDKVLKNLHDTGVPPHLIELEITESAALIDPRRTMEILTRFRSAGLSIAIDDFGCGFSNLSLLAQLPFDTLKIDRSLVESIGTDKRAESVIKAIVHMGHSLDLKIIGEGVETLKQLSFLQQLGCDVLQGFLFARPMSPEAYETWSVSRGASALAATLESIEQKLKSA